MKNYKELEMKMIAFENEDVVRTSTPTTSDENELPIKPFNFGTDEFDI